MSPEVLIVLAAAVSVAGISLYVSISSRVKARKCVTVLRELVNYKKTKVSKPRKRYMVFELIPVSGELSGLGRRHVEEAIENVSKLLFGTLGYELMRPTLVYYDESRAVGIISFKHSWRNHILLALSLIKEVGGVKVMAVPVKTTGTRRRALEYIKKT